MSMCSNPEKGSKGWRTSSTDVLQNPVEGDERHLSRGGQPATRSTTFHAPKKKKERKKCTATSDQLKDEKILGASSWATAKLRNGSPRGKGEVGGGRTLPIHKAGGRRYSFERPATITKPRRKGGGCKQGGRTLLYTFKKKVLRSVRGARSWPTGGRTSKGGLGTLNPYPRKQNFMQDQGKALKRFQGFFLKAPRAGMEEGSSNNSSRGEQPTTRDPRQTVWAQSRRVGRWSDLDGTGGKRKGNIHLENSDA